MKTFKCSLIILNWNGEEDTKMCLDSLSKLKYKNFEVVLVDNDSQDNSVEELEEFIKSKKFSYTIKFIKNERNRGFTGGNISALPHCEGEYIILLNNDIVVDPCWLGYLVETAKSDKNIGVVGGKAYRWNEDNPPYNKKNQFYSFQKVDPWLGYSHTVEGVTESSVADSISGCAVLIKKEVIDKVGFLEEVFFAYYEETDLFARVIRAGYKVIYDPSAEVWHQVGKSSGGYSYFYLYQMARNRMLFALRNFDEPQYSYFKKDMLAFGYRALVSKLLIPFRNISDFGKLEIRSNANAFSWVLRNWATVQAQRKSIVSTGDYNKSLLLENEESISVVIPCYNYGKYVGQSIESALAQKVKPFEVIVVDDGSTDDSVRQISKYPVKLIRQENRGVIAAKNRGFAESKGRFVLFLDADDILKENALSEYLKEYKKDKSVGFVYSDMQYFGSESGIFESKVFSKQQLRDGNYIHNSSLIKREAFEAVGGYHQQMGDGYEDWDLYISLVEQGYMGAYVPRVLLDYRRHEGSLSRNEMDQLKALRLIYDVQNRHRKLFPIWYRLPKKIYLKAYYEWGTTRGLMRIALFGLRLISRFFVLLGLLLTGKFGLAATKVRGEFDHWKGTWQSRIK